MGNKIALGKYLEACRTLKVEKGSNVGVVIGKVFVEFPDISLDYS